MLPNESRTWLLPTSELEPALTLILALEDAPMGIMLLRRDESDALYPVLGRGLTGEQVERFGIHRQGVGPVGTASGDRRRVSIADAWETELSAVAHELNFRAIHIVPLCRGDEPALGVAAAMFPAPGAPRWQQFPNIDLCAGMLACMLENAQLRQAADAARAHAEQIAKDKVEFLARLSHELRNPLNAIAGYLELLRLDLGVEVTAPQVTLLDRVQRSERMLIRIIEDVITFAKLEVGHITYRIDVEPVTDIIDAADLVTRPVAVSRGVAMHVVVRDRRLSVIADASRVGQILTNLLTNAVKFTGQGGIVTLTCVPSGSAAVEFIVQDTGIGIAAADIDAVFRPYVQAGPPLVEGLGGSGLGLAISREFAEAMHGSLSVKSQVGKGSAFALRLPRGPDSAASTEARNAPSQPGTKPQLKPRRRRRVAA